MGTPDPAEPGTPDPVTPVIPEPVVPQTATFAWKDQLPQDYANSPSIKRFEDSKEGVSNITKSYLELEKLLGNEKVPIPKGKDDVAARVIFNRAMGVPDKPDGYALPDAEVPEAMKGLTFDKKKFAEIVHSQDLTPAAARELWKNYTDMTKQSYADALKGQQEKVNGLVNQLRSEWGDAYQTKIELGQMVINKFSTDKETNDFITASILSDPRGAKFLAQIGDQFAENKIGEFKYQRHSLTPDEAQRELDIIRNDMNHPYMNDKAPQADRDRAINYVNSLIMATKRPKG